MHFYLFTQFSDNFINQYNKDKMDSKLNETGQKKGGRNKDGVGMKCIFVVSNQGELNLKYVLQNTK